MLPPIAMVVDGMHFHHKWFYMPHFSSCERAGAPCRCAAWGRVSFMPRLCEGFCSCRRHDLGEQASLLLSQLQRSCCCSPILLKTFWHGSRFALGCEFFAIKNNRNLLDHTHSSQTFPTHSPFADAQMHRPQHGTKFPELPGCCFPQLHKGEQTLYLQCPVPSVSSPSSEGVL